MKERPILFSGPMVRALLDGSKTQTRRALRGFCPPNRPEYDSETGRLEWFNGDEVVVGMRCPYGQPGDRLWVRETFLQGWMLGDDGCVDQYDEHGNEKPKQTWYRATSPDLDWHDGGDDCPVNTPWKPSIHMPRNLSRITLEITAVRVERLWEISDSDVRSEGCEGTKLSYAKLWESINGPGSWDANPWVWVVSFRRLS